MATINYGVDPQTLDGYYWGDGQTSGAAPQIAGIAALVMESNPDLTSMEVYDILRNTASNADSPNNEIGYGIVNAAAASMYYRPQILYLKQKDIENKTLPVQIKAEITSRFLLIKDSTRLFFRINESNWIRSDMHEIGNNIFEAVIPVQNSNVKIDYYVHAVNSKHQVNNPLLAPEKYYSFFWGTDLVRPEIVMLSRLYTKTINAFGPSPYNFVIKAYDNIGIDTTSGKLSYWKNNNDPNSVDLMYIDSNQFNGTFFFKEPLQIGDKVNYFFNVWDNSNSHNSNIPDTFSYYLDTTQIVDDFENGTDLWDLGRGWNITQKSKYDGEFSITDSPFGDYNNNENNSLTLRYPFNLSIYKYAELDFYVRYALEIEKDSLLVEITDDGGTNWNFLEGYTGGALRYRNKTINISKYTGAGNDDVLFRFRVVSNEEGTSSGVFIDDINIKVSFDSVLTNINKILISTPNSFSLAQNYPNPFNPTTNISFALPKAMNVKMVVYNSLGQKVDELVNGMMEPGNHNIKMDGSNLTSGIYFYRIVTSEFSETKKMILLQ